MSNSPYNGILNCVSSIWRTEGLGAFYRSYMVQLFMNAPFQIVHFMTYEYCQNFLNPDRIYNPLYHMVSGGIAGGLAAAITTPLDVCKTLLNTQTTNVSVMFNLYLLVLFFLMLISILLCIITKLVIRSNLTYVNVCYYTLSVNCVTTNLEFNISFVKTEI